MKWLTNISFDLLKKPLFWKVFLIKTILKIGFLVFVTHGFSQEQPKTRSIVVKESSSPFTIGITKPKVNTEYFSIKQPEGDQSKPSFSMTDQEKFLNPGQTYQRKLNSKYSPSEGDPNTYFGDSYLGDFKTSAKAIIILCRDFGEVDGDRVSVLVNDEVVVADLWLRADFFTLELPLKKGFNKIEFQALNQGRLGPNTAEMKAYDSNGFLIHSNQWKLSSGSKATMILVKED